MKIEKLPSGSYRIRKQENGIRLSVTVPYKPTKKEAHELLEAKRTGRQPNGKTFGDCAREYIDGKESVLSPATVRGYESVLRMIPDRIKSEAIQNIDGWQIQNYIDELVKDGKSPKTISNYYGFISAVFAVFNPEATIRVTLPQKRQKSKHMPSDDDIRRILDMAKGTRYEIPLRLACYGLRRSEICALTVKDLDGCRLTINKARVKCKDGSWSIKTTKTETSSRTVIIDEQLADLIRESGTVYDHDPNRIYVFLQKACKRLGIEQFPLHYLRHYFASTMHELGVPDVAILEAGGWKTDNVMKTVYRHAKELEEKQTIMTNHMTKLVTIYDHF